jgi:hypothetical protein
MIYEIDEDFYCSSAGATDCPEKGNCIASGCPDCHRKHPTPEQFRREYGMEVPDDIPVWFVDSDIEERGDCWEQEIYCCITRYPEQIGSIVIACTPFGAPEDNWRPE